VGKIITCVECPVGCRLDVSCDGKCKVTVSGNKCEKGYAYALKEMTSPERYLTSTVTAEGISVRRVSVRTDRPVPKERITEIMAIIHKTKIQKPVKAGDSIIKNVLGLGADIVVTRSAM
jgi:CxxC motif-containing protein